MSKRLSPTFRSLATGPGIGEGAHRRENPAASSRAAQPDREIDLAGTALALAVLEVPSVAIEDCSEHVERLAEESAALAEPGQDPLAAPQSVLHDTYGYRGDTATYDDLENANLALVIERRKGLPVALGILYLHALRACGCAAEGLNFPEHFLIRLDHEGDRRIVDPFDGGSVRSAPELRALLKASAGAELKPHHLSAVGNRYILIRLHNNIRIRHLQAGRIAEALECTSRMLLFAPKAAFLWRDVGVLHMQLGNLAAAISAFEDFAIRTGGRGGRRNPEEAQGEAELTAADGLQAPA